MTSLPTRITETSYVRRTSTGDTDYNPQPQRVTQEIPREIRVPTPLSLDPPDIVVLPATDRIIDYEQQLSVRKLLGAVPTPMQRTQYDRRYHGIYMIVRHRSTYPRYRLPHPVRPLQRL